MVKVISAATGLAGNTDKANYWHRNDPFAYYGYRTATELVADGRVDAVLAFIRDLEDGARVRRSAASDPDDIFRRYLTPKMDFPANQLRRRSGRRWKFQPARD